MAIIVPVMVGQTSDRPDWWGFWRCVMSDSWIWLVDVVEDRDDLAALCLVVGLWGLRVLPSTRRWAPARIT